MLFYFFQDLVFDAVSFLFARGEFTSVDALNTSDVLVSLAPAFLMLLPASILIQYCFSASADDKHKYTKLLASFSVIGPVLGYTLYFIVGSMTKLVTYSGLTIGIAMIYTSFAFYLIISVFWFVSLSKGSEAAS